MTHNLVLTSSGNVWGFGSNLYQQLLLSSNIQSQTSPIQLPIDNIIAVAFGKSHSLFLDHDGFVFSAGCGSWGQLGLTYSEIANRNNQIPTKISSLHNIVAISAGFFHSLFLDSNGKVFSCGLNYDGQLGLNHTEETSILTLIDYLQNIVAISAGCGHSICLDDKGSVWSFGNNESGQLGLNDRIKTFKPERIVDLPNIEKISTRQYADHTMMLDHDGKVWVCGNNYHGRLGLGDELNRNKPTQIRNLPKILDISAGYHSIMLDENGEVWTCGDNSHGELGLNDREYRNVPTKVQLDFRVTEINAGYATSLMIDEEGNLWGCGSNESGKLGLGEINRALVPTRIEGIDGEVHLDKIPERRRIASTLSIIE